MITKIEDYFAKGCGRCPRFQTPDCSTQRWMRGLKKLREICLSCDLCETVKWGQPCYTFAGRNLVIIGAFKDDFRLSFFNAGLMKNSDGLLTRAGPNTKYAGVIRFTADHRPGEMEAAIRAHIDEAKSYAVAGKTTPKEVFEPDFPPELIQALDNDPDLAAAFNALTPGRQKSYVINLNQAKQSATRSKRISKFRDKIIAGKGATER